MKVLTKTIAQFQPHPPPLSLEQACQTQNTVRAAQLVLKGKNVSAGRSLKISYSTFSYKDPLSLINF